MKEEQKIRLINLIGEEKVNMILKRKKEMDKLRILEAQREKDRIENMERQMIEKDSLIDGQHYNGFRWRGEHVARWDGINSIFLTIRFKHGQFDIEKIPYFGDVKETNQDGFIPLEIINKKIK